MRDGALILTAAYLYYVEDRSQEEIANLLGVSRSTVSRLLAEARQNGVVRIEVAAPPPVDGLEKELTSHLRLERVWAARRGVSQTRIYPRFPGLSSFPPSAV